MSKDIRETRLLVLSDNTLLAGQIIVDTNRPLPVDCTLLYYPIFVTMSMTRDGRPRVSLLSYPVGVEAMINLSKDEYYIEIKKEDIRAILPITQAAFKEYEEAIKAYYINTQLDCPSTEEVIKFS